MKPLIIGILGNIGAGKSTAARFISETYGAKIFAFATPIKKMVQELWNFSDEQVYGNLKDEIDPRYNKAPRECFQILGDRARELISKNVWILPCFERIYDDFKKTGHGLYVIDDMRYPSEATAVKSLTLNLNLRQHFEGKVVKIVSSEKCSNYLHHASEQAVNQVLDYDYFINNERNDGFVQLKRQLFGILEELL